MQEANGIAPYAGYIPQEVRAAAGFDPAAEHFEAVLGENVLVFVHVRRRAPPIGGNSCAACFDHDFSASFSRIPEDGPQPGDAPAYFQLAEMVTGGDVGGGDGCYSYASAVEEGIAFRPQRGGTGKIRISSKASEIGSYGKATVDRVNFQIRKMPAPQNIVALQIKALRRERGLTQAMLAARCGTLGWDIGENVVTKIETAIRCVTDVELLCIAAALNVRPDSLLPPNEKAKSTVSTFFRKHRID